MSEGSARTRVVVLSLTAGQIEAVLYADNTPVIEVRLRGVMMGTAQPAGPKRDDGGQPIRATVPAEVLSDGTHVVELAESGSSIALAHVTIIAGEPLEDDLRGEVARLRAELDQVRAYIRKNAHPAK